MNLDQIYRTKSDYNKSRLLYYISRRIRWMTGDRSPLFAYAKVTKRCNLDCYYCPWHVGASKENEAAELSTETWMRKLTELHKKGIRLVVFEGGEPTLRNDIQELLNHSRNLGMSTILATNGYAKDIWNYTPSAFTISVDGPSNIHNTIRGRGSYERIIDNLNHKGSERVVIITVITRSNFRVIEEICANLDPLVNGFLFTFEYNYNASDSTTLSDSEIAEAKLRILSLKKTYPILNPSKYLVRPFNRSDCKSWLSVSIDSSGILSNDCFVDHIQVPDCDHCELSCYQLLSSFYDFDFEAWFNLNRMILDEI